MLDFQEKHLNPAYTGVSQAPSQLFDRCGSSDPQQVAAEVASYSLPPHRSLQVAAYIQDLLSRPLDELTECDLPQF